MRDPTPVKIWRQIILGFIPFGYLFALLNIAKLRLGLAIFLPINIGGGIAVGILFNWLGFPPYTGTAIILALYAIVWTYLIKKWSIEWNKQFSNST